MDNAVVVDVQRNGVRQVVPGSLASELLDPELDVMHGQDVKELFEPTHQH
jgi:hypothetical protein